jgi:glucose/arabinose dehydrogenase
MPIWHFKCRSYYLPMRSYRHGVVLILAVVLASLACQRQPRQAAQAAPGGGAGTGAKAAMPPAPHPKTDGLAGPSKPRRSPAATPPRRLPANAIALQEPNLPLDNIRLRPGFDIAVYAYPVDSARAMCLGKPDAQGRPVVYVGSRDRGNVYALRDLDGNGRADEILRVAKGLKWPVGVAYRAADDSLYISAVSKVLKLPGISARLENPPAPVLVNGGFPKEEAHGWKFIAFGPEGKLYVPVGAPGNIVDAGDKYANIMRMDADGKNLELWCRGVRNTVGFDWHPSTKELYFTDNGRDWLGDDWPPDELDRRPNGATIPHYGYPYVQGGDILDPDFGKGKKVSDYVPPVQKLGAHVAALGMRFYTGSMFPAEYKSQIFIAEHGSWNRSNKNGYRVTLVRLDAKGNSSGYETFADGWLQPGDRVWGRPVDVLVMPDGSLLVSDDHAGAVYRVTYRKP